MSYCRFSEGDVYMYASSEGGIECCACRLAPLVKTIFTEGGDILPFGYIEPCDCHGTGCDRCIMHGSLTLETKQEALAHLLEHREAGHLFPQDAIDRLQDEIRSRLGSDAAIPAPALYRNQETIAGARTTQALGPSSRREAGMGKMTRSRLAGPMEEPGADRRLDRTAVRQSMDGYLAVNRFTALERQARLRRMSEAQARQIFDDLCSTYLAMGHQPDHAGKADASRLRVKLALRKAMEGLARHRRLV